MKNYLEKHHKTFGGLGAIIAFVVAVIYLVVVPGGSADAGWLQEIILAYGHSLCWFLLSAASTLWAINKINRWSAPLAYTALIVYVIFMSTLLITEIA